MCIEGSDGCLDAKGEVCSGNCSSGECVAIQKPDLTVGSWECASCSGTKSAGHETEDWKIYVKNVGTAAASGVVIQVRLLKKNQAGKACGGTGPYDFISLYKMTLSGDCATLAPGQGCTHSKGSIDLPANLSLGEYKIQVKVDPDDKIDELNDGDNFSCSSKWLTIDAPDLVITSASCSSCVGELDTGEKTGSWTIYVDNVNSAPVVDPNYELAMGIRLVPDSEAYAACNTTQPYSYYNVGDYLTGLDLSQGVDSKTFSYMKVPNIASGWYYWLVKIDSTGAINETNESNNSACMQDPVWID